MSGSSRRTNRLVCPNCGVAIGPDWQFCNNCGTGIPKSRRGVAAVAAGTLVIAGLAAAVMWWKPWDQPEPVFTAGEELSADVRFEDASAFAQQASAPDSPAELELPASAGDSDRGYFTSGEGAPLIAFLGRVEGVWTDTTGDDTRCQQFRSDLESTKGPAELTLLSQGADDQVISSVLSNLVSWTVYYAVDCTDTEAAAEMAWNWAVAYRRLGEFGVTVP